MLNRIIRNLFRAFPCGMINASEEFIVPTEDQYLSFSLKGCRTEKEVKAKVLEWLILSKDLRSNINKYLNTQFTNRDFDLIYEHLGGSVNRDQTLKFINGKFSMDIFDEHK